MSALETLCGFDESYNFVFPKRKEIPPTKMYIRQLFKEKQTTPLRVPSKNNISDIMTKNLPTPTLNEHKISIRLIDDPKSHEEFLTMTCTTGF